MKQTQNYGGRPPLPKESVRSVRVVTFLTREENEQLHELAAAEEKSISLTCHDMLVNQIRLSLTLTNVNHSTSNMEGQE